MATRVSPGGKLDFAATCQSMHCTAITALLATEVPARLIKNILEGVTKEEFESVFQYSCSRYGTEIREFYTAHTGGFCGLLTTHLRLCEKFLTNFKSLKHVNQDESACPIGSLLDLFFEAFKYITPLQTEIESTYDQYGPYDRVVNAFFKTAYTLESFVTTNFETSLHTLVTACESAEERHTGFYSSNEQLWKNAANDELNLILKALISTSHLLRMRSAFSATLILMAYKLYSEHPEIMEASREQKRTDLAQIKLCALQFEKQKVLEKFRHKCFLDLCRILIGQIEEMKVLHDNFCPEVMHLSIKKNLDETISNLRHTQSKFIEEINVIDNKFNNDANPKALVLFSTIQKGGIASYIELLDLLWRHVILTQKYYVSLTTTQESHAKMKKNDDKNDTSFYSRIELIRLSYNSKSHDTIIRGFIDVDD